VPLVGDFVNIFTYLILHAILYALYLRNVHYALLEWNLHITNLFDEGNNTHRVEWQQLGLC